MVKVYILGLALVKYVGDKPTTLVGSELKEKKTLSTGDMFVTTRSNAVNICGGTLYELVKEADHLTYEEEHLEDDETKMPKGESKAAEEAKAQAEAETKVSDAVVVTMENIMDEEAVSLQDIKETCKKHNITIGRKKRADLVALLIPYLEQEA